MRKHHQDNDSMGPIVVRLVRAANVLAAELREARSLFDVDRRDLVDAVARWLEGANFNGGKNEADVAILRDIVTMELLQEVLGVTTTLEQIYADAGTVEYEIVQTPVLTTRGERLRVLEEALVEFQQAQSEMEFIHRVAHIKETHCRK